MIVNRSDAAMRALQSLREAKLGGADYLSIVLHVDSDRDAAWVMMADEAVNLGPVMTIDGSTGLRRHAFTDLAVLRRALEQAKPDLVWVGWGFVSESPDFARLCDELGVTLVGPSAEVMELLGDKMRAKAHAHDAGLRCLPSTGPLSSDRLDEIVASVGLPLMVKASAGGGGRGIRVVADAADLASAVAGAAAEAKAAFGDDEVFAERFVGRARHLEVQMAADTQGRVRVIGLRDCSVQRRRQKVVEESASELTAQMRADLGAAATALLRGVGYVGVCTVEFLLDVDTGETWFLEVNTRLQVEHGVTELTTGVDLVMLQLELAKGHSLATFAPQEQGAAVEVRITAENPVEGFAASPGRLVMLDIPALPGVRVDRAISPGEIISPDFDPLVVKVLAFGSTREQAIARMNAVLEESRIAVAGGATTLGMARELLASPEFREGRVTTGWLDARARSQAKWGANEVREDAFLLACVSMAERTRRGEVERFLRAGRVGGPEQLAGPTTRVRVTFDHFSGDAWVGRAGLDTWAVRVADREVTLRVRRDGHAWAVDVGGSRLRAVVLEEEASTQVVIDGHTMTFRVGDAGEVRAPSPCVISRILVITGQRVRAGDLVAITESMKLESPVHAPVDGVVEEIGVSVGEQVMAQHVLMRMTSETDQSVLFSLERAAPGVVATAWDQLSADLHGWYAPEPDSRDFAGVPADSAGEILERVRLLCAALVDTSVLRPDDLVGFIDALPDDAPMRRLVQTDGWDRNDERWAREDVIARIGVARQSLRYAEPDLVALLRTEGAARAIEGWSLDDLRHLMRVSRGPLPNVHHVVRALVAWRELGDDLGTAIGVNPTDWLTVERRIEDLPDAADFEFWRLDAFDIQQVRSTGTMHLVDVTARSNPEDRRVFVFVRAGGVRIDVETWAGSVRVAMHLMRVWCLTQEVPEDLAMHRIVVAVDGSWDVSLTEVRRVMAKLEDDATSLGLQQVLVQVGGHNEARVVHIPAPVSTGMTLGTSRVSPDPIRPLTESQAAVIRMARRGLHHPWALIESFASDAGDLRDLPPGSFAEYDLEGDELVAVDREPGLHTAAVVVGIIRTVTEKHPEGMARVAIFNDPSRSLAALAEPECLRIEAALDLAARERIPVEWYAVSAGARVAMDSGTENMDAVASVLRRLVEFTQADGAVNVVVTGVTVGAQPYFNAEATMLMHTRGLLVMVGDSSMVLTGKDALDFAGAVSADSNQGIGGYARIMGPNGQAHHHVASVDEAYALLLRHYEYTYIAPGESSVRERRSTDTPARDVRSAPHEGLDSPFATVGDIFDDDLNPDRKAPFSMRSVMSAVVDGDSPPLERWADMRDAETAIVWDAHLGGVATCLVGIESHSIDRPGSGALDGPATWTAATLFPQSSKKIARAVNAASGVRPLVVLANLAGFDGSPESLRNGQLEFGAEIGRAIVNFAGPIVLCVVARYHGGAFVVFSHRLSDMMRVLAVRGAKASVIGGAAAASVVFGRDVEARVRQDPRVIAGQRGAPGSRSRRDEASLAQIRDKVRHEVRRELAREFDEIHTIERAQRVGSVDRMIDPKDLRSALIAELR